ncbi:MAG TPA: GNAT family N-acetyltransferase [Candidatus Saccharimonadales bacterium]|nr:GNAT family N-acetyltransferase [Candidatus Saccharimonadales bacterium]
MSYEIKRLSPPVTPEEIEDIAVLTKHLTAGSVPDEVIEENVAEILANPGQLLFVARDESRIVGMSLLTLKTLPHERTAFGDNLVVHPDFRGHGIGELLVRATRDYGDEHGIILQGTVSPKRLASLALHTKLGSEVWDTNFIVRQPQPKQDSQ